MQRYKFGNWPIVISFPVMLLFVVGVIYASQVAPRAVQLRGGTSTPIFIDAELRSSTILTTGYIATNFARTAQAQGLGIWLDLEQGSLTSFEYKIQWSRDGNTWFDEVTESVVAGTVTDATMNYTLTFGGDVRLYKPVPVRAAFVRLAVKGTGTVTSSSCAVYLTGVNN